MGWVSAGEGLLVLDSNPNGRADGGAELLSNTLVAQAGRGVRSLYTLDANVDGRLNGQDPVFAELRLWQDTNGDGQSSPAEMKRLAELGIAEPDYGNGLPYVNAYQHPTRPLGLLQVSQRFWLDPIQR